MAIQPIQSVTSILSTRPNRRHQFHIVNRPDDFTVPHDPEVFFTLNAKSVTKLGRTDTPWVSQNEFTAPILCKPLRQPFVLAEVTIQARFEQLGDQAGIAIFLEPVSRQNGSRRISNGRLHLPASSTSWARVALERLQNHLAITTLVRSAQPFHDQRVSTPFPQSEPLAREHDYEVQVRLKLEKVGHALWAWYKVLSEDEDNEHDLTPEDVSRQWKRCDELADFFTGPWEKANVVVGCYASRPLTTTFSGIDSKLTVEFHELDIL